MIHATNASANGNARGTGLDRAAGCLGEEFAFAALAARGGVTVGRERFGLEVAAHRHPAAGEMGCWHGQVYRMNWASSYRPYPTAPTTAPKAIHRQ